jgi:hypothetical protein
MDNTNTNDFTIPLVKQSAIAPIQTTGREEVTFYSRADLTAMLTEAEDWHKRNHRPAGEWAREYANYIFNTNASPVEIKKEYPSGVNFEKINW